MNAQTEVGLLQAMASAKSLEEQRRLAAELEALRARKREQRNALPGLTPEALGSQHAASVRTETVRDRSTFDTDWLGEVKIASEDPAQIENEMRAEAVVWAEQGLDPVVRDYPEEVRAQAHSMADHLAARYGEHAELARQAFLAQAKHTLQAAFGDDEAQEYGPPPQPGHEEYGQSGSSLPKAPEDPETHDHGMGDAPSQDTQTDASDTPSLAEGTEPESGQEQSLSESPSGTHDESSWPGEGNWGSTVQSSLEWWDAPARVRIGSVEKKAVSLTNVGIESETVGVGTDPQGNRVRFRLTPEDHKALLDILYSDLAINFTGVEVSEDEIIKESSVKTADLEEHTASRKKTAASADTVSGMRALMGYDFENEMEPDEVPADFEVQPLTTDAEVAAAVEPAICGYCGLIWDNGKSTGITPTPGGRCPFEYFHEYRDEDEGYTGSKKTATEGGQTCEVCGDPIAKDPSGEEPATWHHDNGEKHDHEAKPKSEAKESSVKTAEEWNPLVSSGEYQRIYVSELEPGMVTVFDKTIAEVNHLPNEKVRVRYTDGDSEWYGNPLSTLLIRSDTIVDHYASVKGKSAGRKQASSWIYPVREIARTRQDGEVDGLPVSVELAEGIVNAVDSMDGEMASTFLARPFSEVYEMAVRAFAGAVFSSRRVAADAYAPGGKFVPGERVWSTYRNEWVIIESISGGKATVRSESSGEVYETSALTAGPENNAFTGKRRRTALREGWVHINDDDPHRGRDIYEKVLPGGGKLVVDAGKRRRTALPEARAGWGTQASRRKHASDVAEIHEVEVCQTCLMTAANGYSPHEWGYTPDLEPWGLWKGTPGHAAPGDGEGHFSSNPCEGCGDPLGGDRYQAFWMETKTAARKQAADKWTEITDSSDPGVVRRVWEMTLPNGGRVQVSQNLSGGPVMFDYINPDGYFTGPSGQANSVEEAKAAAEWAVSQHEGSRKQAGVNADLWGQQAPQRQASIQRTAARAISDIAAEIEEDWTNVNYAARPYLDAMHYLNGINDSYGMDDARSVVLYFLSNARSWTGEKAKAIKKELKAMVEGRSASRRTAAGWQTRPNAFTGAEEQYRITPDGQEQIVRPTPSGNWHAVLVGADGAESILYSGPSKDQAKGSFDAFRVGYRPQASRPQNTPHHRAALALAPILEQVQVSPADAPVKAALARMSSLEEKVGGVSGYQMVAHLLEVGQMPRGVRVGLERLASAPFAQAPNERKPR